MIQELKNITPFVSFGFGLTRAEINVATPVTVWLDTLYNQSEFDFTIVANGATVVKVSNYEFRLAYVTTGNREIYLNVGTKDKVTTLKSNTLTIIVK